MVGFWSVCRLSCRLLPRLQRQPQRLSVVLGVLRLPISSALYVATLWPARPSLVMPFGLRGYPAGLPVGPSGGFLALVATPLGGV